MAAGETVERYSPIGARIRLGGQLRRLRESRGISAQEAARAIRASESKISRIELGRNAVREIDVADLLTLYGVTGAAERAQLLSLASQASAPGWWQRYTDIMPGWFQAYVGLEEAAESIRIYEPRVVPALLQTKQYAAAVLSLGGVPPGEAERHVSLRQERQRRFTAGELRLCVILEENALRRPVAGRRVMTSQLDYLLRAGQSNNLTLRVTPRDVAGHTPPSGFSVLGFGDPGLPDIVYVEQLTTALYLDKPQDVDSYLLAMERMSLISADPETSARMIEAIVAETRGGLGRMTG